MDAGMEVIFTRYAEPQEIVKAALEEDVDVVGISISAGGHNFDIPEVIRLLRENNIDELPVIIGGLIPYSDVPKLLEAGARRYFGPGSDVNEVIEYITGLVTKRKINRKN